jgi:transposase
MLRDDPWERIEQLLRGKASDPGCTAKNNRLFVESILWIMRTGSPWRDLPSELGGWHRWYVRFARWRDRGVWERVAQAFRGDADLECLFIDSTIVHAHPHSAGAKKKPALRKSAARAALTVIRSAGQIADIEFAADLIDQWPAQAVIADKGYDADHFVATIEAAGAQAVIPPRSKQINPRHFDRHLYRDRNLIERFFARLKHFRRIATRYDKLAKSLLSFIHLACTFVWLA